VPTGGAVDGKATRGLERAYRGLGRGPENAVDGDVLAMGAQQVLERANRILGVSPSDYRKAGKNGPTTTNIASAVLLNGKYKFNGNTYSPKLSNSDANKANVWRRSSTTTTTTGPLYLPRSKAAAIPRRVRRDRALLRGLGHGHPRGFV
jgi:hypothetical protein